MSDSTDILGQLLALEQANERLWQALSDQLHDTAEQMERIEKRLKVVEAWLAAEEERRDPWLDAEEKS